MEIIRKIIHILMGFFLLLLKYLKWYEASFCALFAFLFNFLILPKILPSIFREKKDYGILIYPLSVLALTITYPDNDFIVAASWGLMAFGDGFATIIGKIFPINKLPYNEEKSIGGLLSFIISGILACYLIGIYFDFKISLFHIIFVVVLSAFLETLKVPLQDNLTVPLISSFLFYLIIPIKNINFPPFKDLIISAILIFILSFSIYLLRIIKFSAFLSGFIFGTIAFYFSSFFGFFSIFLFFFFGTALTFIGFKEKKELKIEEKDMGRRGAENVLANLSFPLFLAILFPSHPSFDLIKFLFLSSISTALADTAGSEVGKFLGKKAYDPVNFKEIKRGEEGAVSIYGIISSLFFPFISNLILFFLKFINLNFLILCSISGFFGAYFESILRRKGKWEHSLSNFFNTIIGAAIGGLLWNLIK